MFLLKLVFLKELEGIGDVLKFFEKGNRNSIVLSRKIRGLNVVDR